MTEKTSFPIPPWAVSLAPWVALTALALWLQTGSSLALGVAAIAVVVGSLPRQGFARSQAVGIIALIAGIVLGFTASGEVETVLGDWDRYWPEQISNIQGDLDEELLRRRVDGGAGATELAQLALRPRDQIDVGDIRDLRERARASAAALYDRDGAIIAWDGEHRGLVPEDVQRGVSRHSYRDLPLFGYFYVTAEVENGSVGVLAYLLRASLPGGGDADLGDMVSRFYAETGERVRITEADPGPDDVVWDLELDDGLLTIVLEVPTPEERAAQLLNDWRVRVGLILLVAWILLAVSATTTLGAVASAATLLVVAATFPFELLPGGVLFTEGALTLPIAGGVAVGRVAAVALAAFALVMVLPPPPRVLPVWAVGLLAAGAYLIAAYSVGDAIDGTYLAGGRIDWIAYQLGLAAVLGLLTGLLFAATRGPAPHALVAPASLAIAGGLGLAIVVWITTSAAHPGLWAAMWGVPVALGAWGATQWTGWRGNALSWGLAIALASSAAVPLAWADRFDARTESGRQQLEALRSPDHPELEDALWIFGWVADSLHRAGASDVSVLYDGWQMSGLADLETPVWLQIHRSDGAPGEEIRVGVDMGEPEPLGPILADGWATGETQLIRLNHDDVRYVMTTLLENDDLVSAVAPPFAELGTRSGLGPLVPAFVEDGDRLAVLPLGGGDEEHGDTPTLIPGRTGWQVEIGLDFEDSDPYHAHYLVDLPSAPLGIARASLLLTLNLILCLAFLFLGQGLVRDERRERPKPSFGISFRARVTLALFGFFALANAVFGTVAYRALDQASRRSAQVIAQRVVEDAEGWYMTLSGEMDRLATQVGAELLEYKEGELREGSVEELVDLGLYEAWIPYDQWVTLEEREIQTEFYESRLGGWDYVTAYRRLPDDDILAAQIPLEAGTTALQTTDLVEYLGFVIILGGALSLGLAMLAGRALTRPIHALQIASESVGAGDLGLQLPSDRSDEFGAVFTAFNRMVGRLRRTRRQLVRQSRRTQLIMDEAAVGMVALDAAGKVTLVNPRAEALLGKEVIVGRSMPKSGDLGRALAAWLGDDVDERPAEATNDFEVEDRRVRVRVRRLGHMGTERGIVVAMDDVTDELRAERVLAWGEMARQVAHEVKNPLTPIKLSVQHVRRAWDDGRPDFEDILIKNADAMLSEIDRLAGIAQSFSRFGAPSGDAVPLEGVSVEGVVEEVMALYGSSESRVVFTADLEPNLPEVTARPAELKEVLVNLLENSRLAGSDGTTVSIVARSEEDHVLLRVVDDGHGIPEDVLPRIFEPQFSTRSTGTGLGLAIVQRVVEAWGGAVGVESAQDEGTTVTVSLPIWRPES